MLRAFAFTLWPPKFLRTPALAGMVRVVVARMMMVAVMVMAAGESWYRRYDHHDKKHWKQLFHGGIIARACEWKSAPKVKRTTLCNSFLA
jgi:hypothetical protein